MTPLTQIWPNAFAERYRAKGYWTGETFRQVLEARAAATPDAIAVVGGDQRWSYAELLARAVPNGALICVMDERGKVLSSPEFAEQLARWRDGGRQDVAFVIGGADGIAPVLRDRADFALSFGRMVWPHMLVRVMLAEQLYRAATILGGGPYHRA